LLKLNEYFLVIRVVDSKTMSPPKSKVWAFFQKKDRSIAKCKECFREVKYSGKHFQFVKTFEK